LFCQLPHPNAGSAPILLDELDAGGSQLLFDYFDGLWITGVAPNLDIVDRVSVEIRCTSTSY
jgi:hypothetical protein